MFSVFIKMLHFAWALAPDLVQMLFLFCARRSDATLIHKVFNICACIGIGIYTYTYELYMHTYTSPCGRLGGAGVESVLRASVICLFLKAEGGEEPPLRRNRK